MHNINEYILERLKLSNKVKHCVLPDGITDESIELSDITITFPLILEIDHKYNATIIGYKKVKSNKNSIYYKFFEDKDTSFPVCTMSEKEVNLIFVEEKGIMLNTKYGWLGTIWRQ